MNDCLRVNATKGHNFCSTRSSKRSALALVTIASLIFTIYLADRLWSAPAHTYLVKLNSQPLFGVNHNKVCLPLFDDLIAKNSAHVEDMYPNNNEGELGKWVTVTSKEDITSELTADTYDVAVVEDGSTVVRIPELGNYIRPNDNVRNDKTWGLRLPKIKEGRDILVPLRKVVVAVVDTGIDIKHPALKDSLVKGRNFAGGDPEDVSNRNKNESHSTHVSGTIIAKPGADGFYGIAYGYAVVMPVRVLDESGSGTWESVSRGIIYATDTGANVINMSLGGGYSEAMRDACKYAKGKGVVIVCAKGNSGNDRPQYPGSFPEVIGVNATALKTDGNEERAIFSSYGENSTCSAPGHFIYSTLPGGKYGFYSGTSMACPHAAGCSALILCQEKLTPDQIKSIMQTRGDTLQTDKPIGLRINLPKFLKNKDARVDLRKPEYRRDHNWRYNRNTSEWYTYRDTHHYNSAQRRIFQPLP
ncbi:MAG: S8 family serine peptidase [bacterium]|nr:S8 family serine peptidase [bacterium]